MVITCTRSVVPVPSMTRVAVPAFGKAATPIKRHGEATVNLLQQDLQRERSAK